MHSQFLEGVTSGSKDLLAVPDAARGIHRILSRYSISLKI